MRNPLNRSALGKAGEWYAAHYLQRHGFIILDRGWRVPFGELDIVAQDGLTLVFVEVKTRLIMRDAFRAADAVAPEKQQRLRRLAAEYIEHHRHALRRRHIRAFRYDVVGIEIPIPFSRRPIGLDYRQDAFS